LGEVARFRGLEDLELGELEEGGEMEWSYQGLDLFAALFLHNMIVVPL
jgi:hypothetical protein